jgi:hypothetical protein
MTQEEARRSTKYFGEGVSASVWTYRAPERWAIRIARDLGSVTFYDLDSLKRTMARVIAEAPGEFRITRGADEETIFFSHEEVARCGEEIQKALEYVRSVSDDKDWRELPTNIQDVVAQALLAIGPLGEAV